MVRHRWFSSLFLVVLVAASTSHAHDGGTDAAPHGGHVHFATSCSAEAQTQFDQAVALLHAFAFPAALHAFQTVHATEASCAMSYWGLAMSLLGNPLAGPPPAQALQAGAQALRQAKPVGVRTAREADYLTAVSLLYQDLDHTDPRSRALAYAQAMAQVAHRYPEDTEATVFYALALLMTAPPDTTAATALLEPLFAQQPHHPGVAHYLLLSYDAPSLATRGLAAAQRYAHLAPATPYALHLPAHIFTRLGLWQEAITTNRAAADLAMATWRAATPQGGVDASEALHAMDFLLYAHLQLAQDHAAAQLLDAVRALPPRAVDDAVAAAAVAAMPAHFVLERRRWDEAAALPLPPSTPSEPCFPQAEAITVFAHGLGNARRGHVVAARQDMARLHTLGNMLRQEHQLAWAAQTDIYRQMVAAWVAQAEGNSKEAVTLLRRAASAEATTALPPHTTAPLVPARELLGELWLALQRPAQALHAYEAAQRSAPQRFHSIYGAARAAELSRDPGKARALYTQLVTLGQHADEERPELRAAKAFLAQESIPQ